MKYFISIISRLLVKSHISSMQNTFKYIISMNETIIVLLPLNYTFNNLLLNCCETAWISPNQMSLVEINQRPTMGRSLVVSGGSLPEIHQRPTMGRSLVDLYQRSTRNQPWVGFWLISTDGELNASRPYCAETYQPSRRLLHVDQRTSAPTRRRQCRPSTCLSVSEGPGTLPGL